MVPTISANPQDIRIYEAKLCSRKRVVAEGIDVELIERRLDRLGARALLRTCHASKHGIYVELSRGIVSHRNFSSGGQETYTTRPGMVSYRSPGTEVNGWTSGHGVVRYAVVLVEDSLARQLLGEASHRLLASLVLTDVDMLEIQQACAALVRECELGGRWQVMQPCLHGLAAVVLGNLVRRRTSTMPAGAADRSGYLPRPLRRAVERIEADPSTASFAELARTAGLSQSQLVRSFRKTIGLTPMEYVRRERLGRAQRLLSQTDLTISDIAYRTGFADQSHLTRQFKDVLGSTPHDYRRRTQL